MTAPAEPLGGIIQQLSVAAQTPQRQHLDL